MNSALKKEADAVDNRSATAEKDLYIRVSNPLTIERLYLLRALIESLNTTANKVLSRRALTLSLI